MNEDLIVSLSLDAISDSLGYSDHYNQRLLSRPTPSKAEIRFLLWEDNPEIIEDYPQDPRGGSCLIWGTTDNSGRVAHIVCAYPPVSRIITAYFPGDSESEEWECNYRKRRQPK